METTRTALGDHDERNLQIHTGISLNGSTDLVKTSERIRAMARLEVMDIYVERSFSLGGDLAKAKTKEFHDLMQTIASLPRLRWLRMSFAFHRYHPWVGLPFSVMKSFLEKSSQQQPSLRYLTISRICFTMTDEEKAAEGVAATGCKRRVGHDHPRPLIAVAKLMETNTNIKELRLNYGDGCHKSSGKSRQALLNMLLYKNMTLERLEFDRLTANSFSQMKQREIAFYLSLNQAGVRQRLLHPDANLTQQEWTDAVISNRENLSILYFLLSHNPAVLNYE